MKKVYKYPLKTEYSQHLSLPLGAEILSVANQNDQIVLYAHIDPEIEVMGRYHIIIAGTGHELPDEKGPFIGTVQLHETLFFHVFATREIHLDETE